MAKPLQSHDGGLYPNSLREQSFRLMQFVKNQTEDDPVLHFRLIETSLEHAPLYEALSYRWEISDSVNPDATIICNGVKVQVGHNLYTGLVQIYANRDRQEYIWVDRICIDQTNQEEKRHQILLMPQIYPKAQRVNIWIGVADEDGSSDRAMDVLPQLIKLLAMVDKQLKSKEKPALNEDEMDKQDAFLRNWNSEADPRTLDVWKLFQREWFGRAWTLQEAALAQENCVVMCGEKRLLYSMLKDFADRVAGDNVGHWVHAVGAIRSRDFGSDPKNPVRPPIAHLVAASRMRKAFEKRSETTINPVARMLNALRSMDCTDPKDRIFSVTAFLPQQLATDLRMGESLSLEELYIRFAEVEMGMNKNMQCLAAAGLYQHRISYPEKYNADPAHAPLRLPSWVPDWTYKKINDPLWILDVDLLDQRGHHLFEASGSTEARINITISNNGQRVASVKGIVLDTISKCAKPYHVFQFPKGFDAQKQPNILVDFQHNIKNQVEEYQSLAKQYFRPPNAEQNMSDQTAFHQTLIGRMIPEVAARTFNGLWIRSRPEQADRLFTDFDALLDDIETIARRTIAPTNPALQPTAEESRLEDERWRDRSSRPNLVIAMAAMCKGRRFVVTRDGRMAVAPDIALPDDQVCIFDGACTPFVIRPVPSLTHEGRRCYQLIGECYVHGLMDGEAMGMQDTTSEMINLV